MLHRKRHKNGKTTLYHTRGDGNLHNEEGPAVQVLDFQGFSLKEEYWENGALVKRVFFVPHSRNKIWEVGQYENGIWTTYRFPQV